MHNETQSNTTITIHCTTSTELLLSGTDDSSVTRRTSFKLQQFCHYFVANAYIFLSITCLTMQFIQHTDRSFLSSSFHCMHYIPLFFVSLEYYFISLKIVPN